MPTQNPVGDTTGYTIFTVQPLVLSNISHCSASEQELHPEDPIHNDGSLPSAISPIARRLGSQARSSSW